MNRYSYDGPVMSFDRCLVGRWRVETTAPTERKARSNLCGRWKRENSLPMGVKVALPGRITLLEDGGGQNDRC